MQSLPTLFAKDFETPLLLAAKNAKSVDIVETMLKAKANVQAKNKVVIKCTCDCLCVDRARHRVMCGYGVRHSDGCYAGAWSYCDVIARNRSATCTLTHTPRTLRSTFELALGLTAKT